MSTVLNTLRCALCDIDTDQMVTDMFSQGEHDIRQADIDQAVAEFQERLFEALEEAHKACQS